MTIGENRLLETKITADIVEHERGIRRELSHASLVLAHISTLCAQVGEMDCAQALNDAFMIVFQIGAGRLGGR